MASKCWPCDRTFVDEHALEQHVASSNLHIGARIDWRKPVKPWMSEYKTEEITLDTNKPPIPPPEPSYIRQVYAPASFPKLNITCARCNEGPLERHWHCNICNDGNYDLCDPCLKTGGCGHPMFGRYVSNGKIVHRCARIQCYFEGPTRESLETHYEESSIHGVCLKCFPRPDFRSKEALIEHYRTSPKHHWCEVCQRDFDNENNLREVRNSLFFIFIPYVQY